MANPNIQTLFDFAKGHQRSQVIYAVMRYGFVDLLLDGPKSGEELAALAKTDEGRTCRALRFAAAMGLFTRDPETLKYSLNDVSKVLIEDPNLKWTLLHFSNPHTVHAYTHFSKSLEGGDYPHKALFGGNMWDYNLTNPEFGEEFNKAMLGYAYLIQYGAVAKHVDFSKAKHVVDVAGGHGISLTEILLAHPHLTGVNLDLPSTIEEVKNTVNLPKDFDKVQNRFSFTAGNFFESIPKGGDVYILKYIIHDWPEAEAIAILKNIHKVMPDDGKLIVIERDVRETDDMDSYELDLHVMVMINGIERTKDEYTKLLNKAGFKITTFIPLPCVPGIKMHAIEGVKM